MERVSNSSDSEIVNYKIKALEGHEGQIQILGGYCILIKDKKELLALRKERVQHIRAVNWLKRDLFKV